MFRKKIKDIICPGEGNAMPKAVLTGLKKYPLKISAICARLDSGGSASRLTRDYKVVSPGEIYQALLALSSTSPVIENLYYLTLRITNLTELLNPMNYESIRIYE